MKSSLSTTTTTTTNESLFMPLLLCIQVCLFFEIISLWLKEYIIAVSCRFMMLLFICFIYYFKKKEEYINDLTYLLSIVSIQDVFIAIITRGIFNTYSWLFIYLPIAIFSYINYKNIVDEKIKHVLNRFYSCYTYYKNINNNNSIV